MEPKKYPPYLFDVDFDSTALPPEPEVVEEEPAAPTFSGEELQAARDEAFEAGKAAGLAQSTTSLEQQISATLSTLQDGFASLSAMQRDTNDATMRDAVKIAVTIVAKALPHYASEHGVSEIEAFTKAVLSTLFAEADVIVRVPEESAAALAERLTPVADALGLAGKLKIAATPNLGPADCRMEWGNGGAERNVAKVMSEINDIVSRFVEHGDMPEDTTVATDTKDEAGQAVLNAQEANAAGTMAAGTMDRTSEEAPAASPETATETAPATPPEETQTPPAPDDSLQAVDTEQKAEPEASLAEALSTEPAAAEPAPEINQAAETAVPDSAEILPPEPAPEPAQAPAALPTLPGAIDTTAPESNT